ncbi:MAG: ATP-binding cassette domain-containing protein, partial [Planctomycetia bacterium]|nr:ATP-binding cassette domain-containing protein [Planctomycetia bacterium]
MTAGPGTGRGAAPLVEFHDVTVAYGRRPVLWNIDLTIDEPCLFGIIGPNGAGKSTLLKAALGLVPLAGGAGGGLRLGLGRRLTQLGGPRAAPQRRHVDGGALGHHPHEFPTL